MVAADYIILGVMLVSLLIGVMRGFVREAISLIAWVLSFWVALGFSSDVAPMLDAAIETPMVRYVSAFAGLFIVTMIVSSLLGRLARQLVQVVGLGGLDRLVGALFGVLRGAIITLILVLLVGLTPIAKEDWWSRSVLMPPFLNTVVWASAWLPRDVAKTVKNRAI